MRMGFRCVKTGCLFRFKENRKVDQKILSEDNMVQTNKVIALIGANGMLASAIKKLAPANYEVQSFDLPTFDLTNRQKVLALQAKLPEIIINCAAYTNVDGCEEKRELAMQVNGDGVGLLVELAQKIDAVLVHISTDFVFGGEKISPYREDDQPEPLSIYGKSKLVGEQIIQQSELKKYYIIRTSWLYGAGGNNFVETMIRLGKGNAELKIVADQYGTPTWTDDLAITIFELLKLACKSSSSHGHAPYGLYHYSNEGFCSWYEFSCEIFNQVCDLEELMIKDVLPITTDGYPLPAERPKYSVLSKDKIKKVTGGNPGLTKAGTGDVLAGLCAGFLSQSHDLFKSAVAASQVNKQIGNLLLRKKKGFVFLASDMVEEIKKLNSF